MNQSEIEHMAQGLPPSLIGKDHEEVVTVLATSLLAAQQKLDAVKALAGVAGEMNGVVKEGFIEVVAQRDALAAENAALNEMYRQAVKELDDTCFEMGMTRGEKSMEYAVPETPATDAYLNSVRAEGVEMLAANHQRIVDTLNGDSLFADGERRHAAIAAAAVYFAAKLRAEEAK